MKTRSARTGLSRELELSGVPFRILKRVFGYTKVRYRGILKNHTASGAFALVNLYSTAGGWSARGVVSPETGKRPPETQNVDAQTNLP